MTDYDLDRPFDLAVTGDIVLPGRVLCGGTMGIRHGEIAAIVGPNEPVMATQSLDFSGTYVLPGLVDTHVHTGSAEMEGIFTASAAAAAGGVTTLIDMPYDAGGPVFDKERLLEKERQVEENAVVDIGLFASIPKHNGLREIEGLLESRALAFKFSLFETHPQRFPRILDGDLLAAFEALAPTDLPVVIHAELQEIIDRNLMNETDRTDSSAHGRVRPVVSESAAAAKALEMAYWSGAKVHLAHVTHPHVVALIQWYAQQGARVSGETCVHYLALNEEDVERLGALAKVNPPVRNRASQEMLWASLRDGTIATVSSDHAPWPLEAKLRPMLDAASGIPGLESFLPVLYTEANRRHVPICDIMQFASAKPAQLFGLTGQKGRLEIGYDADFVVFNPMTWTFDASKTYTSAKWSPFDGWPLLGRVEETFLRGRPVFKNGEVVGPPGYGRLLRRDEAREERVGVPRDGARDAVTPIGPA